MSLNRSMMRFIMLALVVPMILLGDGSWKKSQLAQISTSSGAKIFGISKGKEGYSSGYAQPQLIAIIPDSTNPTVITVGQAGGRAFDSGDKCTTTQASSGATNKTKCVSDAWDIRLNGVLTGFSGCSPRIDIYLQTKKKSSGTWNVAGDDVKGSDYAGSKFYGKFETGSSCSGDFSGMGDMKVFKAGYTYDHSSARPPGDYVYCASLTYPDSRVDSGYAGKYVAFGGDSGGQEANMLVFSSSARDIYEFDGNCA